MSACRETPTYPELDVQWQLMTVTDSSGSVGEPSVRTYYCFYRHTVQLHSADGLTLLGNLDYVKGQSLTMHFPDNNAVELRAMSLPVPDDADSSVTGYTFTFTIDRLTSGSLRLTDPDGRIYDFRKF